MDGENSFLANTEELYQFEKGIARVSDRGGGMGAGTSGGAVTVGLRGGYLDPAPSFSFDQSAQTFSW